MKSINNLFEKRKFLRKTKKISRKRNKDIKFTKEALEILRLSSMQYIEEILKKNYNKNEIIFVKNLKIQNKLNDLF